MAMKERGKKLTRGIGINDMDYDVFKRLPDGKVWHCPIYRAWSNMLTRVTHKEKKYSYEYDENFGQSYFEVGVCEEWKTFSNFHKWYSSQDWEGRQLDKDLLGDGTLYSPETCCLIPAQVNITLTANRRSRKGNSRTEMIGTTKISNKYYWYVNYKALVYRKGSTYSEKEAHSLWQKYKAETIRLCAIEFYLSGEISIEIRDAILKKADKLDFERESGVITQVI